jgi:hypothetical protein
MLLQGYFEEGFIALWGLMVRGVRGGYVRGCLVPVKK